MNSGLLKTNRWLLVCGVFLGVFSVLFLLRAAPALAATGINQEINFQGRLLNNQGATVPDGYYNIEFKIYQDGNGQSANDATGSPAGSLDWTEDYLNVNDQGIEVVNGYLSVELGSINPFGSSINWNESTLWLSMNIAGDNATCASFTACGPDGEMLPMQPLTSAVYSLNSNELGGMSASAFSQLSASQTFTGANIIQPTTNVTGLTVQQSSAGSPSADIFDVEGSGGSADNFIQVTSTAANQGAVNISSLGSNALTLTGGTASATFDGNGVFRDTADITGAFQFNNNSGNNILSVDTLNNQIVLGKSNALNGTIQFDNGSNTNSISLVSGATSGTYSLTLPVAVPSTTQCLQSGASTATQLVFATCDPNGPAIDDQTTSQSANFFVTAATSGSVAGVLEANSTGAGDILDLQNGSGVTVDNFTSSGNFDSSGDVAITQGSYTPNQVVISDGLTGAPPAYPKSYTPSFTIQTSEINGSRPLFFGYNNGGTWAATLTTGACGSFSIMCLDLGSGSSMYTGLEGNGTTLQIGGGSDGNFTNVEFANSGDVGIGQSPSYPLDVSGIINTASGYDVNGTALASSNLSDSSSLVKLNGTQTFTAANLFQPTTNVTGLTVQQSSAGSPSADIFDVEGSGGSADNFIQVTSTAANQGAVNISSLGSNALTLTGGSNIALVSGTVYIGGPSTTYSTSSTSDIGYTTSSSGTQIINIGSLANTADSVTINAGATGGISFNGNLIASGTYNTNNLTATTLTFGGTNPVISSNTSNTNSNMTLNSNGTGTLTLNTTGAGTVNLGATSAIIGIGNTTAATATTIQGGTGGSALSLQTGTSGTLSVGTANATNINIGNTSTGTTLVENVATSYTLNGLGASIYNIGAATTGGSINVGGTAQTGNLTLGDSTATNTEVIAGGTGATTLKIADAQTAGLVSIGADMTSGSIIIGSTSQTSGTTTLQAGATSELLATGGVTIRTTANSAAAFLIQNSNSYDILDVDTNGDQVKILDGTATQAYVGIAYNDGTSTGTIAASSGTTAIGNGTGPINITSGSGSAVTITANAASTWSTTAGLLTIQGNNGLTLNSVGANTLDLDSTTSGNVDLGTNANGKAIAIGNNQNATTVDITGGDGNSAISLQAAVSGSIDLGSTNANDITIGSTNSASSLTLEGGSGNAGVDILSAGNVEIGTSDGAATLLITDTDTNATYSQGQAANTSAEVNGAMFYSSTNHDFMCGVAGSWETCDGLLYSNTAASTAINTCTNACAAFSTNYASTIPANYCQAGRTIHIEASGIFGTYTTGTTLAFGLYYGTNATTRTSDTLIGAVTKTSSTLGTSLTNSPWVLNYTVICYSATSMSAEGTVILNSSATAGTSDLVYASPNTAATTGLTTTSAQNLYIFPTWGASEAANTITAEQVIISGQ